MGEIISSSAIRHHLKAGQIPEANAMLGRPYSLRGLVERGAEREPPRKAGARVRVRALSAAAILGERPVRFGSGRALRTRIIEREDLAIGTRFEGPAVVEEFSATTLVPPGVCAQITAGGHLELRTQI
jgi:N-methylhydantoinase A/oxoprolinase/acetone carboxylase beta subunit